MDDKLIQTTSNSLPAEVPAPHPQVQHAHTVTAAEVNRLMKNRTAAAVERPRTLSNTDIDFQPLKKLDAGALGYTVHLKGFASRIDFESEDTRASMAKVLDFMDKRNPDTLVWDGDDFSTKSFTYLIPMIYDKTRPKLICFLRDAEGEQSRLKESWKTHKQLPITCYLCSGDIGFEQLGGEALKATQSRAVVCFGGGGTVKKEYEHASAQPGLLARLAQCCATLCFCSSSKPGVIYMNVSVSRAKADGAEPGLEHAALDQVLLDGNTHRNLVNIENIRGSGEPRCGPQEDHHSGRGLTIVPTNLPTTSPPTTSFGGAAPQPTAAAVRGSCTTMDANFKLPYGNPSGVRAGTVIQAAVSDSYKITIVGSKATEEHVRSKEAGEEILECWMTDSDVYDASVDYMDGCNFCFWCSICQASETVRVTVEAQTQGVIDTYLIELSGHDFKGAKLEGSKE